MLTGSYKNWNTDLYKTYYISGDKGKSANYNGDCYLELAPKLDFWREWKNNRGIIPDEENNKYYIEHYYDEVLSNLDVQKVYDDLKYDVILCYENPDEFCHRHIVASWIELLLDIDVQEKDMNGNTFERDSFYKDTLEKIIKSRINMKGLNCLRALYLFEKGNLLDYQAEQLEKEGKDSDWYRQVACYYRCDCDEAEAEYNKIYKVKKD